MDDHPIPTRSGRWTPPRGRLLRRALRAEPNQEYLLYVPRGVDSDAPVLVCIHGISGNARAHASCFQPLCERAGVVLLVPLFPRARNPDYQRLGRAGRGPRADRLLHACLAEIGSLTGADVSRFHLFGFSAGAQFAHRYVMAHPHRVVRAAIVAAGWYSLPDHRQRFPYGTGRTRALPDIAFNPEEYLQVPQAVFVGAEDLGPEGLRRSERLDRLQGVTRVERASRWVAAMRDAAAAHGMASAVTLTEVPGMGHAFRDFSANGALVACLFDDLITPVDRPSDIDAASRQVAMTASHLAAALTPAQREQADVLCR